MMFHHSGEAPKIMSLKTLKEITNNFSKERELGSGTFGTVYKGVQDNGEEIAIKQLPMMQGRHDDHKKFKAEFENLWRLRHPNIVQLLGYCYEIKHELLLNDGRRVWADNIYRALCFEYMHNGSLEKHLYDEYHGHDWQTRYKIIMGTCDGLKYLHEGLNIPMYHLRLKPENILLDKNMVPKLADSGLSKFIHNDQTQATQSHIGMRGYLPPEYISNSVVPNKFDIFSLGVVMIRIITGNEGYFKKAEMSPQQFIDLVYEKWRNRLHATPGCTSPEAQCHQVKTCIQIALDCVNADQRKRPTIRDILCRLNELEPRVSAAPSQPQQTSVVEGTKESDADGVIVFKRPGGVCFEIGIEGLSASTHGEAALSTHHSQILDFGRGEPDVMPGQSCLGHSSKQTRSECIAANPKGKPTPHTIGTLNSVEFSHAFIETDQCNSSATHLKKGLTTELQKATTNVIGKAKFEVTSPGFSKLLDQRPLELRFPLEANLGIQCHGTMTDRCEEVINKTAGVSQSSIDNTEQGNVIVSSSTDLGNVIKKLNKVGKPVHQEPNISAKDQESSASSKDRKMVRQPQQTQMKELNPRQQPKLRSPKTPLLVPAPVKGQKFNTPEEDIDNIFNGLFNIDDIREVSGDENSMFDGLFHTDGEKDFRDKHEDLFKTDGFNNDLYEPNLITKPLAIPLSTGGGGKNGGGGQLQNMDKVNGVSQSSIIAEQTNVLSGLMDSKTVVKKLNKTGKPAEPLDSKPDVISQFQKQHLGRGGQLTNDTSVKDQNSRCSKDAKTALPQKTPQKIRSMSPKTPFNICEEEGIGDESSMFGILFGDDEEGVDIQDGGFAVDMQEPKMITKGIPLGTGNGDKKGGNGSNTSGGGNEMQVHMNGNGNNGGNREGDEEGRTKIVGTLRSSKLSDVYALELPFPITLSEEQTMELKSLQSILDGRKEPCNLKLTFLEHITKKFSSEYKIGHGGCGEVYKGILPNEIVAVKRLFKNHTFEDKMFHQEVGSLMMVKHKNIVRFLGFCSNTQAQAIKMSGHFAMADARERFVLAEERERLLCFEYISNGNLEKYLTDELRGLEWHTRYQIIKGICEGLNHLHMEKHIVHMDLKPGNILIDDHMVPKITDFGLSRFDEISQTRSDQRFVSRGYCAPEYIEDGKISNKADIYSLGKIMIETVTGCKKEPNIINVLRRWRHRWNKLPTHTTLLWYHQVSKCLELALRCIQKDPKRRPFICEIIHDLNEIDDNYEQIRSATESTFVQLISHCLRGMLGVHPLEIHFPFTPGKKISSCSIQLTNNTDDYIGFMVSSTSLSYSTQPKKGIIPPRSNSDVTLTLQQAQEKAELHNRCRDEFCVQSIRIHESLSTMNVTEDMFRVEGSKEVDEVSVTVVFDTPPTLEEP